MSKCLSTSTKGKLVSGTIIYGLGQAMSRLLSFLLLPLFTKYLTPTDYGVFNLLSYIYLLGPPVLALGFGSSCPMCYFRMNTLEARDTVIWTAFATLAISCSLYVATGWFTSRTISAWLFGDHTHTNLVLLAFIGSSCTVLALPFSWRLQYKQQPAQFIVITLLSNIATVSLTFYYVVTRMGGVEGWVTAVCIANVIHLLIMFASGLQMQKMRVSTTVAERLLTHGFPMIPSFFFLFLLLHGGKYILSTFTTLDVLGIYTVGFTLGLAMDLPVQAFNMAWNPYFLAMSHTKDQSRVRRDLGKVLTYYVFCFGSLYLVGFVFGASSIVQLMTQPGFHNARLVLPVIALGCFILGMTSIQLPGPAFGGKLFIVTLAQGFAALVGLLATGVLASKYGPVGAAAGFPIGTIAMVYGMWRLTAHYQLFIADFEIARIMRYLMLAILMVTIYYAIPSGSLQEEIVKAVAFSISWTGITYLNLTRNERIALLNRVPRWGPATPTRS